MYHYQVYTPDKRIIEGDIDASTEDAAEEYLLKAGYNNVLTLKKARSPFKLEKFLPYFYQVKKIEIVDLFQQLATLSESRMPVVQSLWLLGEQSRSAAMKEFIARIGRELSSGTAFSQALSFYPKLIPAHYREVIKVSEQSGDIARGLRLAAGYMEKEIGTSKNITRMLAYPSFLVLMAVVVIIVLANVALPSLTQLFNSLNVNLPLPTKILVAVTGFMADYNYHLAGGLGIAALAIAIGTKSAAARRLADPASLKVPAIGQVIILRNICRFCRNTAMLLEAGLTLPQAMNSVIGVIDNSAVKGALHGVRGELIKGKGISRPMSGYSLFPRLLVDMVGIGERTDSVQSSFAAMADYYEKRLDQRVQRLLAMIEPASIIIVGLIISLIGLAIIMPIYSIYQGMY